MNTTRTQHRAADGTEIFRARWEPDGPPRGTVCLVHGFGEHSGRYDHVGEHLTGAGYVLSALDLRGHGRSAGKRGDTRFGAAMGDIDELLQDERVHTQGPLFLYGHSLGGLIVLIYAIERDPDLSGLILSAPMVHTAVREQTAKVVATRILGRVIPSLTIAVGLDQTSLSRDPAVVEAYSSDPLVHGNTSVGLGIDGLQGMDRVLQGARSISLPVLLFHGGADRLNYLSGSKELAPRLGEDCTFRIYEGLYHEPHNEPEKKQVLDDLVAWLDKHG